MKGSSIEVQQGLCTFLKADPIALANQVLDNKVQLPIPIKRMLVDRLYRICGKPASRLYSIPFNLSLYDNEGKAIVADLAVRIHSGSKDGYGRKPSMDSNGLYAVITY
jgi:hypothetical protein